MVKGLHIDATDFSDVAAIIDLKVDATDNTTVYFVNKIVINRGRDGLLRALAQALRADAVLCDVINRMGVGSHGTADRLVVVAVNHCPNANLVENFIEQHAEETPVENVRAGRADIDCFGRVLELTE